LTGSPGVGKTTLLLKIVDILRAKGYRVGGMVSREVRSHGARIGFEILDLASGKRGWLAHVNQKTGPQVGRYRVNLEDLDNVGAEAILKAVRECDIVAVDEIGPMELFSEKFKLAVNDVLKSEKLLVGVVHWKARDKLVDAVKRGEDSEIFTVTRENRDTLHRNVVEKALEFLIRIHE
jgi:nucleoside-triphosphatase